MYVSCIHLVFRPLPHTFQRHAVASDGHNGVVYVVFSGKAGVHVDQLKVHWHTTEPKNRGGKRDLSRYVFDIILRFRATSLFRSVLKSG